MRATLIAALTAAAGLLFVTACTTTPTEEQKPAPTEERKPAAAGEGPRVATVDLTKRPGANPLKDPDSILSKRSIYYEFDKFDVKDEYRGMIEAHAKYLRDNPGGKMLIQGNTDERGGTEYNLALGQKRAEAVRKSMATLGVAESQMEAVSLGKEKPKALGSGEAAWAENRRADIVY